MNKEENSGGGGGVKIARPVHKVQQLKNPTYSGGGDATNL
jgi:hypothetical protein